MIVVGKQPATAEDAMRYLNTLVLAGFVAGLAACSSSVSSDPVIPAAVAGAVEPMGAPQTADAAAMKADPRLIVVHKSATCGCCHLWVDHVQSSGFKVVVRDVTDLVAIKERVGVPLGMVSCHTAEVGGYFLEGHVPAADIVRLLEQRPSAKGLTVPGMPAGSPGMEVPSGEVQPYDVHLVAPDGSTTVFAHHGGPADQPGSGRN
jgi:hypothetical protein